MEYKPDVKVEGNQTEERRHVVAFKRPYVFEQKEYTEVDLSGLDALTVKDAIEVQKQLFGQQEVAASLCPLTMYFWLSLSISSITVPSTSTRI